MKIDLNSTNIVDNSDIDVCRWIITNTLWEDFYIADCGYNARHSERILQYCPLCNKRVKIEKGGMNIR